MWFLLFCLFRCKDAVYKTKVSYFSHGDGIACVASVPVRKSSSFVQERRLATQSLEICGLCEINYKVCTRRADSDFLCLFVERAIFNFLFRLFINI